jgi:hypothetical protein
MKIINQIINFLISGFSNDEIFEKIGTIKKRIGNNFILEPQFDGVLGIGVILYENKISKISFVLKETVPFVKINEFSNTFHLGFNHYDQFSCATFELSKGIKLIGKYEGYLSVDEITKVSFSEFELYTL